MKPLGEMKAHYSECHNKIKKPLITSIFLTAFKSEHYQPKSEAEKLEVEKAC